MPDIQIVEIVERIASVDSIIRPAFYELSNHTPLALRSPKHIQHLAQSHSLESESIVLQFQQRCVRRPISQRRPMLRSLHQSNLVGHSLNTGQFRPAQSRRLL
jgi:hypothetical protein